MHRNNIVDRNNNDIYSLEPYTK